MRNSMVLILLLIGVVLLSGCVAEEKAPVKYVNEKISGDYFIFYPDGEFNAFGADGTSASGTYRTVDNELILTYRPFGNVLKLKKEGDAIVDSEGNRWIKTK